MTDRNFFRDGYRAEDFKQIHGHETPWNDETDDCDVFERPEFIARIANKILEQEKAKLKKVYRVIQEDEDDIDNTWNAYLEEPHESNTDYAYLLGPFPLEKEGEK